MGFQLDCFFSAQCMSDSCQPHVPSRSVERRRDRVSQVWGVKKKSSFIKKGGGKGKQTHWNKA